METQINFINSNLSNFYSEISIMLVVCSLIWVAVSVVVSVYVAGMKKKVSEIKKSADNLNKETIEVKDLIESYINDLSKKLYIRLRRDDTISMLEMLDKDSKNLLFLGDLLVIKDFMPGDFSTLKKVCMAINNDAKFPGDHKSWETLIYLLLKNFPENCVKDNDLRSIIFNNEVTKFRSRSALHEQFTARGAISVPLPIEIAIICFQEFYLFGFQNNTNEIRSLVISIIYSPEVINNKENFNKISSSFKTQSSFDHFINLIEGWVSHPSFSTTESANFIQSLKGARMCP